MTNNSEIYPIENIQIAKNFFSVYELNRKYNSEDKKIVLDEEFQRNNVWDFIRKSELIESVLMGLPLPVFYFSQDKFGKLIVIDGRQRLNALFSYIAGNFRLKGLKILKNLNNCRFCDLETYLQWKIEDYQITANIILPPTKERVLLDIFDRVNRGGMPLNKQEMRNALYQGPATYLLKELSSSDVFANATDNAFKNEKRMKDRLLINRFWAFYIYSRHILIKDDEKYEYKDDIDDFLGRTLETINNNDKLVQELKETTISCLKKAYFYLGVNSFRFETDARKSPINMNIFETVMLIMSFLTIKEDKEYKDYVKMQIQSLLKDSIFLNNIKNRRDNSKKIEWRISVAVSIGERLAKW